MNENDEVVKDVSGGLAYIREHPEINNVLLTGGDPLILATHKLERIIHPLREIDHVRIIRIGSKMPAFNPYRIIDDASLPEMLSRYSTSHRRIYLMAHFNHPVELTEESIRGINELQQAGVVTVNQTPLIRGVNDDPEVLRTLFNRLWFIGVPPYYVFQCRPTVRAMRSSPCLWNVRSRFSTKGGRRAQASPSAPDSACHTVRERSKS